MPRMCSEELFGFKAVHGVMFKVKVKLNLQSTPGSAGS